jgi:hypothetical protein
VKVEPCSVAIAVGEGLVFSMNPRRHHTSSHQHSDPFHKRASYPVTTIVKVLLAVFFGVFASETKKVIT